MAKTTQQITQDIFENYLPGFWKQEGTNLGIIDSFSGAFQGVYISLDHLSSNIFLTTASGTRLDEYGLLFKLARNTGELDVDYRNRLLSYYQTFVKSGTDEGIVDALSFHFDFGPGNVEVQHVKKFQNRIFIANMEAAEGWTGPGVTFDSTICYKGTRSIKLTSSGAIDVIATWTEARSLPVGTNEEIETFNVWYKFDDSTKVDNVKLIFTDGTITATGTIVVTPGPVLTQGFFNFYRKDFTNHDTIDWENITEVRLQMSANALTHMNFDWLNQGLYDNSMIFDIHANVLASFDIADFLSRAPAIVDTVKAIGTHPRQFIYSIIV